MNNGYDINSILPIDNIRQVKIYLGTDQGKFEIDMSNLLQGQGQLELEQRTRHDYSSAFEVSKQVELLLRCRPIECAIIYHPPCDSRENEESDDCEELKQFLSSFERRDEICHRDTMTHSMTH